MLFRYLFKILEDVNSIATLCNVQFCISHLCQKRKLDVKLEEVLVKLRDVIKQCTFLDPTEEFFDELVTVVLN